MKYNFKLTNFANSNFDIKVSALTGNYVLLKDNIQIKRSKENKKPFLIPNESGEILKAYPIQIFPDLVPTRLEINGVKYNIINRLKPYQYILGGMPLLLILVGGLIGGIIGYYGTMINYNLFRQTKSELTSVIKVVGVIIAALALCLAIVTLYVQK